MAGKRPKTIPAGPHYIMTNVLSVEPKPFLYNATAVKRKWIGCPGSANSRKCNPSFSSTVTERCEAITLRLWLWIVHFTFTYISSIFTKTKICDIIPCNGIFVMRHTVRESPFRIGVNTEFSCNEDLHLNQKFIVEMQMERNEQKTSVALSSSLDIVLKRYWLECVAVRCVRAFGFSCIENYHNTPPRDVEQRERDDWIE